jgi:hypothetical protein
MSVRRFAKRPSPALAVAVIALVFAMTGTAVAAASMSSGDKVIKKHSLSGNRLRNRTLTGTQIDVSKLGTVPHAQTAGSALSAHAATIAGTANVAKTLPKLVWHALPLINDWEDYFGSPDKRSPAYAVDAQGIVHLRGSVERGGGSSNEFAVFPAGISPSHEIYLTADTFGGTTGRLEIHSDGQSFVEDGSTAGQAADFTSLDGITYALG